jgi:hypothetical protein
MVDIIRIYLHTDAMTFDEGRFEWDEENGARESASANVTRNG